MERKPDIFDRIFSTKLLRFAHPFYAKYRRVLLYLLFGGLTTVISIGGFWLFTHVFPCDPLIANILSWFFAVLFAFLTNRTWVFQEASTQSFGRQMISFYLGRVATLLVEELILFVFVTVLGLDELLIKIAAQVVVLILNYVLSKLIIFKRAN